jgi:hypothetical protein
MQLFDDSEFAVPPPPRPYDTGSAGDWRGPLSHPQFEFGRTRAVFGNREGWGPLLVAPDTNLLIHLVEAFDSVESHFGVAGPIPAGDRDDPVEALRELFAYWFHRDIRWVIFESYLTDSRKPLSAERTAGRERVLAALTADLADRGGAERASISWDLDEDEQDCLQGWIDDDRTSRSAGLCAATKVGTLLTGYDGRLVAEALSTGCHVFLTEDRGILGQARTLFGWGLSVLRPGELLDLLETAGELVRGPPEDQLIPDLLSLARFYAIAGV